MCRQRFEWEREANMAAVRAGMGGTGLERLAAVAMGPIQPGEDGARQAAGVNAATTNEGEEFVVARG